MSQATAGGGVFERFPEITSPSPRATDSATTLLGLWDSDKTPISHPAPGRGCPSGCS